MSDFEIEEQLAEMTSGKISVVLFLHLFSQLLEH